jgi:hypothetical protein
VSGMATTLTRDDLDALPDDGLRHELIDGACVMTPTPGRAHQRMVGALFVALRSASEGTPWEAVLAPPLTLYSGQVWFNRTSLWRLAHTGHRAVRARRWLARRGDGPVCGNAMLLVEGALAPLSNQLVYATTSTGGVRRSGASPDSRWRRHTVTTA